MKASTLATQGTVRGWHVLFLYAMYFAATAVIAHYITRGIDYSGQKEIRNVVWMIGAALMMVLTALVVPELRALLRIAWRPSVKALSARDFILVLATMACWTYGASRLLFIYPIVYFAPNSLGLEDMLSVTRTLDWATLFFPILLGAVLAPLGEELVFRGLLLNLWKARWGLVLAVTMSSLVFGLFHGKWTFFATGMGFILALVYMDSGSLWPCILLHGLHNLGAAFYSRTWLIQKDRQTLSEIGSWIPEIVLTVILLPLLVLFWRRFRPIER